MSILNVNKINPVGGGSTITISGIASVTGSITGEHHGDGANLRINDIDNAGSIRTDCGLGVGSSPSFANLSSYVSSTGSRTSGGLTQTADSYYALDLWNGNNSATFVGMLMQCRTTGAAAWLAGVQHTSNYLGDYFLHARNGGSSSAIVLRQKPTGELCIGNNVTGSPSATLHVRNSGNPSSTLGGAPASIMIETTSNANWANGEAGAELLFKKGGDITAAIRAEHDRSGGSHSYEDCGLAFYTAPSAETPPRSRPGLRQERQDASHQCPARASDGPPPTGAPEPLDWHG